MSVAINYRNVSVLEFARQLQDTNPTWSFQRCKAVAAGTKRNPARSCYSPCYGAKAAARNLRHIAAGTHGY